jgi:hypothetical protein
MFNLYSYVEDQINDLIVGKASIYDNRDMPSWLVLIIKLIATFVTLSLVMFFGILLWNQGLSAAMPKVFSSIGSSSTPQLKNDYLQLLVTLFALGLLL